MTKFFINKNKGFLLLEIVVSISIFSIILFVIISAFFSMNTSNSKTEADRGALENAKRALEEITYEIRSAESIYTPTTTANQLSLETLNYLPSGESNTFIDFFLCGSAICLKKESQDPIALTSNSVNVTNLLFSQILTGTKPSVQINLTVSYPNPAGGSSSSTSLTSTASLRNY